MVLMIDNYDSFVYNIVQYLGELKAEVAVYRNDAITVKDIEKLAPESIVISPGPGRPEDAGISCDIIKLLGDRFPILGVCLGHQCIGHAFGGRVIGAPRLMHGKTSEVFHDKKGIFKGIPSPFTATRYHSLIVEKDSLPDELEITAWTQQDEIMGLRHRKHRIFGVQFHPESILTEHGMDILSNFISLKHP
ncbi:MAG TPA: aminodeoxychorismate/anthranilate synthase component II [bacterium]|nr:aminodeoxychorismate/anthranilate synthase component II [bacterium]